MCPARTLHPHDHRTMPWKNGLGSTTELVIEPPGASLEAFHWRLSIAELRASGPFSTFAGYDRVIVQLDGSPMTLAHAGGAPVPLQTLVPYAFSGDEATACTLDGSAHDFNLMVRRDHARAALSVHTLQPGETLACEAVTTVLHLLVGALEAPDEAPLGAGDTRLEAAGATTLYRARSASIVLVATLRPPSAIPSETSPRPGTHLLRTT